MSYKAKICKVCKTTFIPKLARQRVCCPKCAITYSNEQIKKEAKKKARQQKKELKEQNITLTELKKKPK